MNVLVIGGGGREHAIAWKLRQSPLVADLYVAPGNGGTAMEEGIENIAISATDIPSLLKFARERQIELAVVGPEAPLALGITDAFKTCGIPCFGPSQKAAQLEVSKGFCKDFMTTHKIPTAAYGSFNNLQIAKDYVKKQSFPLVIKADGLAAGKGVVIAQNYEEAEAALEAMLVHSEFGEAGANVIVEAFLEGEEASFIVLTDGKNILPLASSQDHKARDDGDIGPNTGGMGAYSPAPVVTAAVHDRILSEVIHPAIKGMAEQGTPYVGFLYAGMMVSPSGDVNVLEFNCRMGDPETQPIMMRLKSDLAEVLRYALAGRLNEIDLEWDPRSALGVVLASGGYPGAYEKGHIISGLGNKTGADCKVFHAGTATENNQRFTTSGGRVLCVTALGDTLQAAQEKAYAHCKKINWTDMFYRRDIGAKAL